MALDDNHAKILLGFLASRKACSVEESSGLFTMQEIKLYFEFNFSIELKPFEILPIVDQLEAEGYLSAEGNYFYL